ncbi:MAG: hypothetical protein IT557_09925 [Alphaproteobacteria bacterium]|nr:hypothetical protein [Alphaproteobacteria bacterium]
MPFRIRDLSVLAYANGFTLWHYQGGADSLATISGLRYFDAAAEMLGAGDLILVAAEDGSRLQRVARISAGRVTIDHPAETGTLHVFVPGINLADAGEHYTLAPAAGFVTALRAVVGAETLGPACLQLCIGGQAVPGGAILVPPGQAAGATFHVQPASGNAVSAGSAISLRCDGQAGRTSPAVVVLEITRA